MGTKEQWSLAVVSLTLLDPDACSLGRRAEGRWDHELALAIGSCWDRGPAPPGLRSTPLGPFVENPLPCLELWDVGSFSLLSTPSVPSLSCAVASLPERS